MEPNPNIGKWIWHPFPDAILYQLYLRRLLRNRGLHPNPIGDALVRETIEQSITRSRVRLRDLTFLATAFAARISGAAERQDFWLHEMLERHGVVGREHPPEVSG